MKEAPTAVVSEPRYFAPLPTGFGKSCIMQGVAAKLRRQHEGHAMNAAQLTNLNELGGIFSPFSETLPMGSS